MVRQITKFNERMIKGEGVGQLLLCVSLRAAGGRQILTLSDKGGRGSFPFTFWLVKGFYKGVA